MIYLLTGTIVVAVGLLAYISYRNDIRKAYKLIATAVK